MSEMSQQPERSSEEKDELQHEPEPASTNTPGPVKQGKAGVTRKNWREVAAFFVSFGYTRDKGGEERLHTKVQSRGGKAEQWSGVAADQLVRWMVSQADVPLPPEPELPLETQPPLLTKATLKLAELWVSEVRTPAPAGQHQSAGLLRAEGRLSLEGSAAHELTTGQLSFSIELYLVNTQTHQSRLIAAQPGQLRPGELSYEIRQNFPVPAAGRYQLYAVARLLPPGEAAVHFQGPIIRVET